MSPLVDYRFHASAEKEAKRAAQWYDNEREGLGMEFLAELGETIHDIRANPQRFPRSDWGTREGVRETKLHRFPYLVVYEFTPRNDIVILAVAHAHRRPGYWRRRRG